MMPVAPDLAGERPVDEYVRFALSQNPQIQAQRKRVDAAAQRVPQAASLEDPTFEVMGFPFENYAQQTAGGRMQANLTLAQEVPWFGKLDKQAEAAEAEVDMARAELTAAELEIVEQVKRAYYELYYVQRAIEITGHSRELAESFARIADTKFRTAQVSQQDLLRAELEISNIDTELVRLRQEQQSAQARLARLMHVSPETPVRALTVLPPEQIPQDLNRLYSQAIAARPELHAQLAAVRRDRYATDLARLQYFPDVRFALGYGPMTTSGALAPTADGVDNVSLGFMANLPIYHGRLRAGVHEAESNVVASAREYDNLRDQTQEEIKDLFAQATSQQELLRLFIDEIVPKADQTLQVSITAYEANDIDFLQLIDNWQQLLRYQLMQQQLEAQLRQTLATLERTVGGTLPVDPVLMPGPDAQPEPAPAANEPANPDERP
jgi:outer membrane protein TolC